MKVAKFSFTFLTLVTFLLACGFANEAAGQEKIKCVVGYSAKSMSDVDYRDAAAALKLWSQEIGNQYGFHVETTLYESVDKMVWDFSMKKLDFAVMNSVDYLSTAAILKVKPEMARFRNGKATIKYLLIGNGDNQNQALVNLKNKNLAMLKTDQLGLLFLNTQLLKEKLPEADRFFSSIQGKNKESQAVLAVFFGQADACIVSDVGFRTMVELNPQVGRKLQVISESPDFIQTVGSFRSDYPTSHKEKAIQGMRTGITGHARGKQIALLFNVDKMDIISESQLDSVKKLVADHERLNKKK